MDTGLWPITATELRTKFKSRQALQEAPNKNGKVMDGWTFQLKGEGKWKSFRKVGLFWMKCLFRKKHLNMRVYIILLYLLKGRLLEFLVEL